MSADYAVVIYWYNTGKYAQHQDALQKMSAVLTEHGYGQVFESDLNVLCKEAEQLNSKAQHSVFIPLGDPADLVVTTVRLRTISAVAGIVPVLADNNVSAAVQLLLCGADACSNINDNHSLFVAQIGSILRRMKQTRELNDQLAEWELIDQAWSVRTPEGETVSLTTIERDVFLTFLEKDGHRASHDCLLSALSIASEQDTAVKVNRLGVIVSRLRRKFERQNIDLPLKSVHNWGYMFAAPIIKRY